MTNDDVEQMAGEVDFVHYGSCLLLDRPVASLFGSSRVVVKWGCGFNSDISSGNKSSNLSILKFSIESVALDRAIFFSFNELV